MADVRSKRESRCPSTSHVFSLGECAICCVLYLVTFRAANFEIPDWPQCRSTKVCRGRWLVLPETQWSPPPEGQETTDVISLSVKLGNHARGSPSCSKIPGLFCGEKVQESVHVLTALFIDIRPVKGISMA